ncbi:MAG: YggT family protein [Magnetococcales bacterium]|nr:YggT family protein [Magnetococcales bacterium]
MGITESMGQIIMFGLEIYSWLILIRILLSWVNPDPYNPIIQFLIRATEPVMAPARRLIPPLGGTIDLSPIVVLIGIHFLQRLVAILFSGHSAGGGLSMIAAEVLGVIHLLLTFYMLLLFIRAGINLYVWFQFKRGKPTNINIGQPFIRFIFTSTEPAIRPIRAFLPTLSGLDLSPVAAATLLVLLLSLLRQITIALSSGGGMVGNGMM